jgi:hypothetical protein
MRTLNRRRLLASSIVVVTAVTTLGAVPSRAGSRTLRHVPCSAVAVSPSFATDRTVFCAAGAGADRNHVGPVNFYRSSDAGRTWVGPWLIAKDAKANGALVILPSPGYAADHTIFVDTERGGYASTDAGVTFTLLTAHDSRNVGGGFAYDLGTVFLEPAPAGFARQPAIVSALERSGCCDKVIYPELTTTPRYLQPVPVNFATRRYLIPPDFGTTHRAVAVQVPGTSVGGIPGLPSDNSSRVVGCDVELVCSQVIFTFPQRSGTLGNAVNEIGPTYQGSADNYALISDLGGGPEVEGYRMYRSHDHGQTWAPWTSVTRLFHGYDWVQPRLASSPDNPKRLWLRLTYEPGGGPALVPAQQQLFRSDDDGRTWTNLGVSWGPGQKPRSRSTLPWNGSGNSNHPLIAAPGGHLYLIGEHRTGKRLDYLGLYCSHDFGRRWSTSC